jgi:mono/diheme cytochrome c family protein
MGNRSSILVTALALIAIAIASACGGSEEPAPAPETTPAAVEPAPPPAAEAVDYSAQAKELFDMRCTACHGALGAGDGPRSANLDPQPRNYRDPEWQDSVSDEQIKQVILYGGEALGKSAVMPGNPDLVSQDALVDALVRYVRSFKR